MFAIQRFIASFASLVPAKPLHNAHSWLRNNKTWMGFGWWHCQLRLSIWTQRCHITRHPERAWIQLRWSRHVGDRQAHRSIYFWHLANSSFLWRQYKNNSCIYNQVPALTRIQCKQVTIPLNLHLNSDLSNSLDTVQLKTTWIVTICWLGFCKQCLQFKDLLLPLHR